MTWYRPSLPKPKYPRHIPQSEHPDSDSIDDQMETSIFPLILTLVGFDVWTLSWIINWRFSKKKNAPFLERWLSRKPPVSRHSNLPTKWHGYHGAFAPLPWRWSLCWPWWFPRPSAIFGRRSGCLRTRVIELPERNEKKHGIPYFPLNSGFFNRDPYTTLF